MIFVATLSLCTISACNACDTPSEARKKNLQEYQFEGMSWKDMSKRELLVPPGKRVVTFSIDNNDGTLFVTYIVRPLSEGEQPKTYDVYRQYFDDPRIINTFKLVEQAAPSQIK